MDEQIKLDRLLPLLDALRRVRSVDLHGTPEVKRTLLEGTYAYLLERQRLKDVFPIRDGKLTEEQSKFTFNLRLAVRMLREVYQSADEWEAIAPEIDYADIDPDAAVAQLLIDDSVCVAERIFEAAARTMKKLQKSELKFYFGALEYWVIEGECFEDPDSGEPVLLPALMEVYGLLSQLVVLKGMHSKLLLPWGNVLGAVDLIDYHGKNTTSQFEYCEPPVWQSGQEEPPDASELSPYDAPQKLRTPCVLSIIRARFLRDSVRWAEQVGANLPVTSFPR